MAVTIKQYELEHIGRINLKRSSQSRRIRLQVKADGEIYVTMPLLARDSQAIAFIEQQTEWIQRQQQYLQKKKTIFNESSDFSLKFHHLKIVRTTNNKRSAMLGNQIIQINIPTEANIYSSDTQVFIRKILIQVIHKEASSYLPLRIKELSEKHNLPFREIRVKNVKTRWGSCSSLNNINLNIHLMRLPDHLIDYVILHELVHTIHKNHQTGFWKYLSQIYPQALEADRELKQYRTELF